MMQKLIAELHRLYLLDQQIVHRQSLDGTSDLPAGDLTEAVFAQHLQGAKTIALDLVTSDGLCRAMVIDFNWVAHGQGAQCWRMLCEVANALQQDLGLPAPAVAVSGCNGYSLWLSLETPVPVALVQQFFQLLRQAYFSDVAQGEIDMRPGTGPLPHAAQAMLPPCLHRVSGKWAVFIKPGLGGSFTDEPWLDMAPALDRQAALLADVQSTSVDRFKQALATLKQQTVAAPAAGDASSSGPVKTDACHLSPGTAAGPSGAATFLMRYQMLAMGDGRAFRLDTQTGCVSLVTGTGVTVLPDNQTITLVVGQRYQLEDGQESIYAGQKVLK